MVIFSFFNFWISVSHGVLYIKNCLASLSKLGGSSQERYALSSVEGPVSTPNIPFLRLSSPPHPILSAHIWLCLQPEGQCRRILISLIMYLESTCNQVVCVWGKHSGKSAFCSRCPYKGLVDNAFKGREEEGREGPVNPRSAFAHSGKSAPVHS